MKTKNRQREKQLRPLTAMQLETLIAIAFGEVHMTYWKINRPYLRIFHGDVEITGRLKSLRDRRLIKNVYVDETMIGFMVTPKGIEALQGHPEF